MSDAVLRKPILVTGAHRSGTTWVGRMLAAAPSVLYIHEPFSVTDPPGRGICNVQFKYWFTYVIAENEAPFYKPLKRMIELRYDVIGALKSARSIRDLRHVIAERRHFETHRRQGSVAMIKDPVAVFSAEWLAARFGLSVVVMIRHPAGFVSSIKKLNWSHPFSHFVDQPLLTKSLLSSFEAEVRDYAAKPREPLDQAILLWRLIYHAVAKYRRDHADWIFLRLEDLAGDVLPGFRSLFSRLNLDFSERIEETVQAYSRPDNPIEAPIPIGSDEALRLHSARSVSNWKTRLAPFEIKKIRTGVEDVCGAFYSDEDW